MEQCIAQQGFVLCYYGFRLKRCFFSGENLITHWKNQAVTGKIYAACTHRERRN